MAMQVENLPGLFSPQPTLENASPQEKQENPLHFPTPTERYRKERGNEYSVGGKILPVFLDEERMKQRFKDFGIAVTKELGFDVYNSSIKTKDGYIAGRIEQKNSEHSLVGWFREVEDTLVLDEERPFFELQDPFVTYIAGELVFGGVRIEEDDVGEVHCKETVFYRDHGLGIDHLEEFAVGPPGMKDIRLVELKDKRVAVITRPQGGEAGKGQIGSTVVNTLSDLTTEIMEKAPIIANRFPEGGWGGFNGGHGLSDGRIGSIGHAGNLDEYGDRQYPVITFKLDPITGACTPFKVVLTTEEIAGIEKVEAKKPDVREVIFPSGFEWDKAIPLEKAEVITIWGGVSDSAIFTREIPNPFRTEVEVFSMASV